MRFARGTQHLDFTDVDADRERLERAERDRRVLLEQRSRAYQLGYRDAVEDFGREDTITDGIPLPVS